MRSVITKTLLFIVVFSSLIILLFPVRNYIDERLGEIKKSAVAMLENRIGHKITYSSIAPSVLHAFEIRDFVVMSAQDPYAPLIRIEKLRLSFNLFKINRENPLEAFQGLLIVNSELAYDDTRNDELLEIMDHFGAGNVKSADNSPAFSLPDTFFVRGRNISLRINSNNFSAGFARIFFSIERSSENDLVFTLKSDAEIDFQKIPDFLPVTQLHITSALQINGRVDPGLEWVDLNIKTKNFSSELLSIDKIAWNVKYDKNGLISVTKTGDNIPADLNIKINTGSQMFGIDLQAQDLVFNRYFDTGVFFNKYRNYLDSVITGEASFTYFGNNKNLEYSGELAVRNLNGIIDGPLSADFVVSGNNNKLSVAKSKITAYPGSAGFSGTIVFTDGYPLVNGTIDIPEIELAGIKLQSGLNVSSTDDRGYDLSSRNTSVNGLELSELDVKIIPYQDNIEFRLNTGVLAGDEAAGTVYSEGIIQLGENYYLQTSMNLENLSIAPVINAIPGNIEVPTLFENFEATAEIFISGTLEQFSFASPLINLDDKNYTNRNLSFSLSGNNSSIRLSSLDLNWDDNYLRGKVSTDLTDEDNIVLQANLDFNGTAVNISGVYSSNGDLSLTGDFGLRFNLFTIGDIKSFNLVTERLPVKYRDNESFLSLNTTGYFQSLGNWKILFNDISIDDIPTGFGNATIGLSAYIGQNGGNVYKLKYEDSRTVLSGLGSIQLSGLSTTPEGLIHLDISSSKNNENYRILLGFGKEKIEGNVVFRSFPIRRAVLDSPVEGTVNGNISIAGTPGDPQFRLYLNSKNAMFNGEHLELDASLSYEDLDLQVDYLNGSYGTYKIDNLTGLLDIGEGKHKLTGKLTSESKFLTLSSEININARTGTVGSIFAFPEIFHDDLDSEIFIEKIKINEEKKDPWRFNISKNAKLVKIDGGVNNEINFSFYEDGYFTADVKDPFPVKLAASGTIHDGQINATISDIHYVFNELHIPFFIFYRGDFSGKLRIQGPLNDPDFFGQLDFHNFVFKPPIIEDITKPFETSFFFSGRELTLPATKVRTNNGLVYINLKANMERWLPREYDIKINVPQGEAITAQFYRNPFYIYGFCEGSMRIYGDFIHMIVDGDLQASEGTFMVNNSLNIPSIGSPTEYISSDLTITIKENDQFLWPNQDVPIVKGFLSPGSKLRMLYDTETGIVLDGDMQLKGGEIFYFERNFYIKEGELIFNNSTPTTMDPLLSARAEIRDVSAEGEMTKIYLIVDESPLSSFTPRFESEPSMSTAEILSLIGGNIFGNFESNTFGISDAVLMTTDVFTQFAIMRSIEDGLKSSLGLDLLSIRSSFLSNFIENTFFTGSDNTQSSNFAKYLDNTTLFLGKYFSDDIFLQGMFQFDLYNNTGYSGDLNMNIDSEIKLEWEGPIANIELSFYPDFIDPIEGINKTSLGLSWRFSY